MGVKVREKKPGEWWIFIVHNGQRRSKKIGKDRKMAEAAAKKIEAKLALGDVGLLEKNDPGADMPTLQQYVIGRTTREGEQQPGWLDRYCKLALKRSTWSVYETLLNVHILPEMGALRIDQITPRLMNDLIVKKFSENLKSQTVKNLKHCLSSILQHGHMPDGYIDRNPVRGVKVPKPENEQASREPDPFPWDDRTTLEKTYRDYFPGYYPLILTAFRTGLRLGELLALQWGDIDFKHRLIRITRNLSVGRITTPKTRSSVRDVRMTTQLLHELQAMRAKRKAETLKSGWPEVPEWIFCNGRGNLLSADNFRKRIWDRAMEKSGLRRRTPHDMRHTYATLRLSKGDSLAEVSKEMGHASAEITYKTYYKWLPKESRTDIDELDNVRPSAPQLHPERTKA